MFVADPTKTATKLKRQFFVHYYIKIRFNAAKQTKFAWEQNSFTAP